MHNYSEHGFLLLKRFVVLLVLYTVSRLFFIILNYSYFQGLSLSSWIIAFAAGIRFDIAAIVFTNIFLLFWVFPGAYKDNRIFQITGNILFFAVNALAIMSNFIDARFFDFINKRSTTAVFSLLGPEDDIWHLLPAFLSDYWYVALSWLAVMIVFWKWMPRLDFKKLRTDSMSLKTATWQTLVFLGIVLIMLWGARGTKLKPISMTDATNYVELKYVPIVINTPFSLLKTMENKNVQELHYLDKDILNQYFQPVHQYQGSDPFQKKNIVIFILESFSKEYCEFLGGLQGYTPNLDSLLSLSRVYPAAYANGTQSYEAMPAIIAGIPSLMDRPYSGSNYADNYIESIPSLLRKEGYQTSFYHGGNNGTMGFNNFAKVAGIEFYNGRNEYNNDADYDGYWGIWDEPYLTYFANDISRSAEPFFSAVFTLSSHHPYNVPGRYKDKFPEGKLPILKSIAYADFALGQFFKVASKMPWYNNTIFIFTADHAAQAVKTKYNSTTGMFSIPLAFYCPSDSSLRGIDSTVCQQIDIMPTVLDYLRYPKPYAALGKCLFDNQVSHTAICYVNGIYQLIEGDYVMQFDGQHVIAFYDRNREEETKGILSPDEIRDPAVKKIYLHMLYTMEAMLQTYHYNLIHNTMALSENQ